MHSEIWMVKMHLFKKIRDACDMKAVRLVTWSES